jgi:hypothetical protein
MDPERLMSVSCLQISDTGVWINYDAPERPKIGEGGREIKGQGKSKKGKKGKTKKGKTTTRPGNDGRTSSGSTKSTSQKPPRSYHTPGKALRWTSQQFPMDTTPPSQFQVQGGKCKWNDAEVSAGKRKLVSMERGATLHDNRFTETLSEKRIEHGMANHGVQGM